jgi:hypothetical protein
VTSDAQIIAAAIVAAGTTLGALVRAAAGVVRDAMQAATAVIAKNTDQLAHVAEWLGRVDVRTIEAHARVVEVHREISDVHEAPPTPDKPATFETKTNVRNTPAGGYSITRGKTHG